MNNAYRTKEQLNIELVFLRHKVAGFKKLAEKQKRIEGALKRSQEKYIALFDNMNDAVLVVDAESGIVIETNKKGELLFGSTHKEIIGMHRTAIHPPGKSDEYRKRFAADIQRGHFVNNDGEIIRKDGSIVQVSISAALVTIGGKKLIIGLFRDITERKKAEEKLKESEEHYRILFESTYDIVQCVAPDCHYIFVNPAWHKALGYTKEELSGLNLYDIVGEKDYKYCKEQFTRVMAGESIRNIKATFVAKDGRAIQVEGSAIPRIINGKVVATQGFFRDITEHRKMEEQLKVTDRLASIGELTSGIAHELNNPLTSILGFSKLLLEKNIDDDIKEDIAIINHEAIRAADVVKNLLTFARKHKTSKQQMKINSIIASVLGLRHYEHKVNNVKIITRFASDLPDIVADSFQIRQVFFNIIMNAEYAMEKKNRGGIVTITTEKKESHIRITFTDNGAGISEENLGYIFNPFFTTKEVGEGTGLGLSICHGIITEHGGRIYARSEAGEGATFIIELPVNNDGKGRDGE